MPSRERRLKAEAKKKATGGGIQVKRKATPKPPSWKDYLGKKYRVCLPRLHLYNIACLLGQVVEVDGYEYPADRLLCKVHHTERAYSVLPLPPADLLQLLEAGMLVEERNADGAEEE